MSKNCLYILPVVMSLVALVGCGEGNVKPPTFKVTGTVMMKGEPVGEATVKFHPEGGAYVSTAKTDAQGKYEMEAVEGAHKVAVSKIEATASSAPEGDEYGEDYTGDEAPENTHLVPAVFASPNRSKLTAKVMAEGENVIDFDLSNPPTPSSDGSDDSNTEGEYN